MQSVHLHLANAGLFTPALRMLTKWFQTTRLETRTKESNIYASVWVLNSSAK